MADPATPTPARAIIRKLWRETPKLTAISLELEAPLTKPHEHPGQYLVVHTPDGKKVYLAIASAPGESALELLLGEAASARLSPAEGATLLIEPPGGNGFPMHLARDQDVLLFATGSAISALRPVVEVIRKKRTDYGKVTLYVGAHSAEDFAYSGHFGGWERDRIDVIRATSKPWVQDLFARDPLPVERAVAFIAGQKDMMDQTTDVLVKAGLAKDRILRNF